MKHYVIKNIRIVTSKKFIENGFIEIEDGKIKNFGLKSQLKNFNVPLYDGYNYKVFPGFIDCHIQGGYGVDFESKNLKDYISFAKQIAKEGITSYIQTCLPDTVENIKNKLLSFSLFLKQQKVSQYKNFSKCLGIHLETKSENNKLKTNLLDKELINEFQKICNNNIKIVSYDLENDINGNFLKHLKSQDIIGSVGHCYSDVKTFIKNGVNYGLNHVSTLFNNMSGLENMNCGVAAGSLNSSNVLCELIADNNYVEKTLIDIAFKIKGHKKLCLTTNSTALKGMENNTNKNNHDKQLKSVATYNNCFKNMKKITNANDIQMLHMTSKNIAEQLKLANQIGDIDFNMCADLVFLDNNYNVKLTIVDGVIVYFDK